MSVALVLFGCLPLVFGGLMDRYMMQHMDAVPPYFLISVLFLLLWFGIAFFSRPRMGSAGKTVCRLNLIPLLFLALAGVQLGIRGAYWPGAVGMYTQFFFLPLVWLSSRLMAWTRTAFAFMVYVVCFGLMVAASYIGCRCRKK